MSKLGMILEDIWRYTWHSFAFHPSWIIFHTMAHPPTPLSAARASRSTATWVRRDAAGSPPCGQRWQNRWQQMPHKNQIQTSYFRLPSPNISTHTHTYLYYIYTYYINTYIYVYIYISTSHDCPWLVRPGAGGRSSLPKGILAVPVSANAAALISSSCRVSRSTALPS